MDPIYLDGSPASVPYDQIEIDDDDEEDQLASDIDEQPPQITRVPDGEELEPDPEDEDAHEGGQTQATTANGKRKHQRKSGERVPGHTLVPVTRLENILRADGMTSYQTISRNWLTPAGSKEKVVRCRKRRSSLCRLQQYVPPSDVSVLMRRTCVCRKSSSSVSPRRATSSRAQRNETLSATVIWVCPAVFFLLCLLTGPLSDKRSSKFISEVPLRYRHPIVPLF